MSSWSNSWLKAWGNSWGLISQDAEKKKPLKYKMGRRQLYYSIGKCGRKTVRW